MPIVSANVLQPWLRSLFAAAGAPDRHADVVAAHLVGANLAGHDSHGALRTTQYLGAIDRGELLPAATPHLAVDRGAAAIVDGRRGFGQVTAQKAISLAVEKAADYGVAAVAARNCYHSGRLGSYVAWAAERGYVGIVMVNAGGGGQTVVPFGGLARRLATNPIAIAAPSDGPFPVVLDIATSVAPEGKVRACQQRGEPLPVGWIVDRAGRPTTDPTNFYCDGGALLPLGGAAGHKGFGLALMIDILAGALSEAGCCREEVVEPRDGLLLIALDVARFTPLDTFRQRVGQLVAYVKSSPAAPGCDEVLVPGEREHRQQSARRRDGIPLDDATWRALVAASLARGGAPPSNGLHVPAGPHVLREHQPLDAVT